MRPDVPLVVVTCIEDREIRYQALEAGATDFLTKPVDHLECRAQGEPATGYSAGRPAVLLE